MGAQHSTRGSRAGSRKTPSRKSRHSPHRRSNRKIKPHSVERQAPALDAVPSLPERVQAEREQLFKALSIVECCKNATATLFEVSDSEYMVPAFEALCDLLNTSAGELERIASDFEKSPERRLPARRRT